jgi:hypothetical protein
VRQGLRAIWRRKDAQAAGTTFSFLFIPFDLFHNLQVK